jgi:SAM-dependent methyltransferase
VYTLKSNPYSSHTLLVGSLPAEGCGRRVLDLGCADGYLARILMARGYSVTGVERYAPPEAGFEVVEADLDAGMPVVSGPYDYVLCADILEHLREPLRLLKAVQGVLAPGGTLIASLPNSGHLYFRLNVLMGRFPQHDRGLFDRTHVHFYMWHDWRRLLAMGGFEIRTCRTSGVPVGLALPRWEGTLPVRLMERLSYDLARIWKRMFAYQFIVTAGRVHAR